MVYFTVLINSVIVYPCIKNHFNKRNHLGKDQPNVDHFYVSCRRQALSHTDEDGCQHQETCQVNCNNGLKEEILKEVCDVHNHEDQDSRKVDCHDRIVDSSRQNQLYMNSIFLIF